VADAQRLPFPDGVFDACRTERVLQYLDDADRAIAEMERVLRPGGRLVATEIDWDTMVCDLPGLDRETWRRTIGAMSDHAGDGWMGRSLARRLRAAGLDAITVDGVNLVMTDAAAILDDIGIRASIAQLGAAGAIAPTEAARVLGAIDEAVRADAFFWAITWYTVSGRKPGPASR
jgi:SAM-dependent methyltransferase